MKPKIVDVTVFDVRMEDETVWLSQARMVELFQSSKANISEHIKNIFAEGELIEDSVVRNESQIGFESLFQDDGDRYYHDGQSDA